MIQIEEAVIKTLGLSKVNQGGGSPSADKDISDFSDEEYDFFKRIFLKPFTAHTTTFEFSHPIDINYNVLFKLSKAICEDGENENFSKNVSSIVNHLTSVSKHVNIKDGDLFIAKFEDIRLGNKYYEGLGIYKFEDKEDFIDTSAYNDEVQLKFKKGIGTKKPDKACLILYTDEPYTLFIIDNNSSETDYWQNEFIKQTPKNDFINNTSNFLDLTKDFVTKQIPQEFEVNRTDQIDLLNRSAEYFKTHDKFEKRDFEKEVLQDKDVIQSFRKYNNSYAADNNIELSDEFEISSLAVKKQAKIFKSVLKLDKNFHIYIHGDKSLIEPGMEKDGRKFYKIFYDEES
jgi:hypothetical protein